MKSQYIPHMFHKYINELVTLGSFSPESFHIRIGCDNPDSIDKLSVEDQLTFNHEFGHLLHYLSSYMGLLDLKYWGQMLEVIEWKDSTLSPEQVVTRQSEKIIEIARQKQIISIDDEYYYEIQDQNTELARSFPTKWIAEEVVASLFRSDGVLSNSMFWAIRFDVQLDQSSRVRFTRIPVGIRTVLEHVAKAIDLLGLSFHSGPSKATSELISQAYEPELLHYYALSHSVSIKLDKELGITDAWLVFQIAGQLSLLLSEIPYDNEEIWGSLKKYAKSNRTDLFDHMNEPHPSFLFPLILKAAINVSPDFTTLSSSEIESRSEAILAELSLPKLSELTQLKIKLADGVKQILSNSKAGSEIVKLLEWTLGYAESLEWADRVLNPAVKLTGAPPVPVVFLDNTFIEGTIMNIGAVEALSYVAHRKNEMLRYHYARNIV